MMNLRSMHLQKDNEEEMTRRSNQSNELKAMQKALEEGRVLAQKEKE